MSQLSIAMGQAIKEAREKKGLSRPELAERIGVNRQAISNIERGVRELSAPTIEKIANGLGMEASLVFE